MTELTTTNVISRDGGRYEQILRKILSAQQVAETKWKASEVQRSVCRRQAYMQLLVLRRERDDTIALREDSATTLCRLGRLCASMILRRWEEFNEEIRSKKNLRLYQDTPLFCVKPKSVQ